MPRRKKKIERKEAVKVVDYYISNNVSMKDAAFELGMSLYRFRKCIRIAIEESWISEEKAELVKKKAIEHQGNRGYNNYKTPLYYRKEEIKRKLKPLKAKRMELLFIIQDYEYYGLEDGENQLEDCQKRLEKVEKKIMDLETELKVISGQVSK